MAHLPSTATVEDLRSTIAKAIDPKGGNVARRLVAAIERDRRGGSAVADGYPGSTLGDGGSRGTSSLTPTERAANARAFGRRVDPIHEHALGAARALATAAHALAVCLSHLDRIDTMTEDRPLDVRNCEACAPAGFRHEPEHYGDVGGRLKRPMHLCADVYQFVYRRGELPTAEQIVAHDRTGRWRGRDKAGVR